MGWMSKTTCCVALAAMTIGCESKTDNFGNPRLDDDAFYLKDAQGRCLRIERTIDVIGGPNSQSGKLDVFVVPPDQPCQPQAETKK